MPEVASVGVATDDIEIMASTKHDHCYSGAPSSSLECTPNVNQAPFNDSDHEMCDEEYGDDHADDFLDEDDKDDDYDSWKDP